LSDIFPIRSFQQFDGKDTVEKTTVENSIEKTKKLLQERKAGK